MIVKGKNILVKELKKDITVDGIIEKYDDSSDYIFVKIIAIGQDLYNIPEYQDKENIVLVLNRINKISFLGNYIIHENDVKLILTKEEYDAL